MGFSTKLYAVNLDEIRNAIGSKNDLLLNKMCEHVACFLEEESDDDDLSGDVVVKLTADSRILFRGKETGLEELCRLLLDVPSGTVEFVIEPPWTEYHDEVIRATNEVVPKSGLERVVTRFETDDPSIDTTPNVTWTRSDDDDEIGVGMGFTVSPEALTDLIYGNVAASSASEEHGKALEVLCYILGMMLPDDDLIGDLAALRLDTDLNQVRSPVEQLALTDTLQVGYLESEDVLQEAIRLSKEARDAATDEETQEARNALVRCIKQAAVEGMSIVRFTH